MRQHISFSAIFILVVALASAQNNLSERLIVTPALSPVKIDGMLNEEDWNRCPVWNNFMQAQPVPGAPPSIKTEVRVLYDNEYLYVAVTAYDSTGQYIVSGLQRDKWNRNDDGIDLMLDTYNDKSHALLFFSNVMGARFDEEVSDNGSSFNSAYNTFWDVKTHLFDGGYVAEFSIPFSSLRFQTRDEVVMGLKVIRQVGKRNEYVIFPECEPNLANMLWRVNSEAEIVLRNLKSVAPLYLTPYLKANYSQVNSLNAEGTKYESASDFMSRNYFVKNETADRILSNIGCDAKIGISKNFTLDATLNTDFAQAEADNRVFNFTRFNIFLPEKRQFFLEANDYLNLGVAGDAQLFNSRTIGIENGNIIPIVGGLRLTGKSRGWQVGALDMQTQGLSAAGIHPENFGVLHVHKDLFKNGSFASAFFSNRMTTSVDSISNQTLGFDFLHRINDVWTYGLNVAGTRDIGDGKFLNHNMIYNAVLIRSVSYGYSTFVSLTSSGKNFNPLSGFCADRGYRYAYAFNGYTWQIKNKPKLNYFDLSTEVQFKWRATDNHYFETNSYAITPSLSFKNGMLFSNQVIPYNMDYLPFVWNFTEHISIPSQFYYMRGDYFTFESPKNQKLIYSIKLTADKFYGGRRFAFAPEIYGGISKHLNLKIDYLFTHISFPSQFSDDGDGKYFSHLIAANTTYSFNTQISLSSLIQYDDVSKVLGANFRFRYNPLEGTDLYIVYNPNINTTLDRYDPPLPQMAQQVLIIKFSKTFSVKTK
ncbi:MAG TPA: DUF5916 domain-containing protein [Chitinophagales bacterium]|nr:DUF5916 domain-containing protein [Chitinophagales bacterium]